MKIQEFKAPTASAALSKVRETLGAQALILSSRPAGPGVEGFVVTAALPNPGESLRDTGLREESVSKTLRSLKQEIAAIRDSLSDGSPISWPSLPGLQEVDARLRENGVGPRLRKRVIDTCARGSAGVETWGLAAEVLGKTLPVWPSKAVESKPRILSFTGPTGAGKTTTLAKLAGKLVLEAKKKIGLVTFDTYRIAAVEQIRAYADMLGAPLQVAFTPSDASKAIKGFHDCDVILIDTAGRSPFDNGRLQELAGFLNSGDAVENLLVLSALTSSDIAEEIMDRFSILNPVGLVLTKLDETRKPGGLMELIVEKDIPVAYLCDGQEVPSDLQRASGESLALRLLAEPKEAEVRTIEASL